jgi:hypothetical protein
MGTNENVVYTGMLLHIIIHPRVETLLGHL